MITLQAKTTEDFALGLIIAYNRAVPGIALELLLSWFDVKLAVIW